MVSVYTHTYPLGCTHVVHMWSQADNTNNVGNVLGGSVYKLGGLIGISALYRTIPLVRPFPTTHTLVSQCF